MSKQIEDIIMKSIMELFKGDAVRFFGINKHIVSVARTELSQIHIQKNINDWVLSAEDESFLHFEFQTTYDKDDLARFMVSDAMLYFKERKPIRTIVVYSAEIEDTITSLDANSIYYSVEAFYMVKMNGDEAYEKIKAKIEAEEPLTKQDLMSIVFLPLMKNSVDKYTRFEQALKLSKDTGTKDEQLQIQAMLGLLAEKFIADTEALQKLKELISMGIIFEMIENDIREKYEMIKDDIREDAREDVVIEMAKKLLKRGIPIDAISEDTGLPESKILVLKEELKSECITA